MKIIVYCIAFILLVLAGVKISNVVIKKYRINRWILAFTAPLVITLPLVIFKNLSPFVLNILIVIFSIESILFFEITKGLMEEREKKISKYRKKQNKNQGI